MDSEFELYLDKVEEYTKKRNPNILSNSIISQKQKNEFKFAKEITDQLNPEDYNEAFIKGWQELVPESEKTKLVKN